MPKGLKLLVLPMLLLAAGSPAPAAAAPSGAALRQCPALAWSPPAEGGIAVAGAAGLDDALAAAKGGGTLLLAGGAYGSYRLSGYNPSATVTIAAADPADPPVFGNLTIDRSSDLTLAGLTLRIGDGGSYGAFNADDMPRAMRILDSRRIKVLGSLFVGAPEPPGSVHPARDFMHDRTVPVDFSGLGRGRGIDAVRSADIEVLGSTFADLSIGTDFVNVRNARFVGNTYTGISVDSTDWGGIDGLLFSGNLIENNRVPKGLKHTDLMQFRFSTSRDIVIRNNVLISRWPDTHGIYLGGATFDNYRYSNVTIANNLLLASQLLALSVQRADGLLISGNKVVSNAAAGRKPAAILVEESSTGVQVTGNVANLIGAADIRWRDRPVPGAWDMRGNQIAHGGAAPPATPRAPGCNGR